jgi:hypothetical protein
MVKSLSTGSGLATINRKMLILPFQPCARAIDCTSTEEAESLRSGLNHSTLHDIAPAAPIEQLNRLLSRRSAFVELNEKFSRSTIGCDGHPQQATRFQARNVSYTTCIGRKGSNEFSSSFGVLVKF